MSEPRKKVLVSEIFGNGKFPIAICVLDTRPNFYIVRIDSKYKPRPEAIRDTCPPEIRDFMQTFDDDVWDAIEYQFGCAEECDCKTSDCPECRFPALGGIDCTYWAADADDLQDIDLNDGISFCVVATNRADGIRRDISGAMPYGAAKHRLETFLKSAWDKKHYKFFKLARHPFAPSIHGTGGQKLPKK